MHRNHANIKRSIIALGLLVAGAVTGYPNEVLIEDNVEIIVERNVPMTTRDGVTLRADVYRPKSEGKYPVILERTPYDKRDEIISSIGFGRKAVSKGYAFIVQDVRGRYASDGEWYPLMHEGNDGYDSVEWAAALPYSNGKVGMFGGSYIGFTQMLAAIASPPHLVCIMPVAVGSDWIYHGGAFSQLLNQQWSTWMAVNTLERRVSKTAQATHWDMKRPPVDYPLLEIGAAAGLADYYYDWLAHPNYDDYWKQWSFEEHFGQIKVPALHVGAWYDLFEEGTVRDYLGITSHGGSVAARKGQRLIMMVGGHAGAGPKIGDIDFGKEAVVDTWALALRWYDYWLKGIDNGMAREKPVRIFIMGRNVWRDEDDWPPANAKATRYFLHSEGKANSLVGDGTLSTAVPFNEAADRYIYDPADPVPTHGGAVLGDTTKFPPGPLDHEP